MTNLNPEFWGPYFWKSLHLLIIGLPDELTSDHRQAITDYFNSLLYLLPCKACRQHYALYFEESPVNVSTKKALWQWSVNLHNYVNKSNKKKEYTYDEALVMTLKNTRSTNQINYYKWFFYFLSILIIMVCIFKNVIFK